ncbi:MAG TPA: DUF5074 domain-containing protein [Bacteroidales bacterium]|jgi:hypothetical protein|nr:DUF5074 domain-containing protein [Bacteroidales bacterium]
MKKIVIFLLMLGGLFACNDMESVLEPDPDIVVTEDRGGLYVLCDGNYSLNNSTLAVYDFGTRSMHRRFFEAVNGRKLGDTGNEMLLYGSKLYVVMNVSSQLEVLDARTGLSLAQIPFFDADRARQPRDLCFWEDKVYVCSFDGTVARVDTALLQVDGVVKVGRNPDGITYSNGKLYVSNSGGLDYATGLGYERTVSILDAESMQLIKTLDVGLNPGRIRADRYGYVYVSCRGNYSDVPGTWVCIDAQSDEVHRVFDLDVLNFDVYDRYAYLYHYDYERQDSWIKLFDLLNQEEARSNFITDATVVRTPYGVDVRADNGDVFITDAGNFVTSGDVCCFDPEGRLKYRLTQVGVSPNSVVYVSDFVASGSVNDTMPAEANYIARVWAYAPAPGQFVGRYPSYEAGDDAVFMLEKVSEQLIGRADGLVSLGAYGGSLVFSFAEPIRNRAGLSDFTILGNAFSQSAEPGIVEVSVDANGNGLPDDPWFELAGSAYAQADTKKRIRVTYQKPTQSGDSVQVRFSDGRFERMPSVYPDWAGDSIVFTGTLLAPTATRKENTGFWILNALDWGYADNKPNISEASHLDLDWAVDADGHAVALEEAHFVRVYTGVYQHMGVVGELSTEICGAILF